MTDRIELTPQDLARIGGFIGCDKTGFAKQLGISLAYLSRVLCGKNKMTANISDKALELLDNYVEGQPSDFLTARISDKALEIMPAENKTSMAFLHKLLHGMTDEDFEHLRQRLRTFKYEKKKQEM